MYHSPFVLLLFYMSALSCSIIPQPTALPHHIFTSEEFIKLILRYSFDQMQVREVAKIFKASFEEACEFEISGFDHQFRTLAIRDKNLIEDVSRIPMQIPLTLLLQKYLASTLLSIKEQLDLDYPEVNVIEGKRASRLRKRRDRVASEKFISLLFHFIKKTFYHPGVSMGMSACDLYHFYKLVRAFVPHENFAEDLVPLLHFPMAKLLEYAANGSLPDQISWELLTEFRDILQPVLIFDAFKASKLDTVRLLLTFPKAAEMVTIRDDKSRRAIHYAAHFGDMDLVTKCLQLGVKGAKKFDQKGEMPIHKAAARGHLEVFKHLHASGAPVNGTRYRPSPILNAVKHGHTEIVHYILQETNFSSLTDEEFNYKLLETAVEANNPEIAGMLRCSFRLSYTEDQIIKLLRLAERKHFDSGSMERALTNSNNLT